MKKQKGKYHKNITLMFIHHFFDRIHFSMKNTFLQDHFIYLKFKKNKIVGLLSIINSLVCLLVSPFVGIYCDQYKHKRTKLLQIISIIYLFINIIYYMIIKSSSLKIIIIITAITKIMQHSSQIITESIFIESIQKGQKSIIFTYQKLISTFANIIGPFLCLILFYINSDVWDINNIFFIFQFSIITLLPQTFISFLWNDVNSNFNSDKLNENLDILKCNNFEHKSNLFIWFFTTKHIPYLVFLSHIITLAGAGMTFKYFSLFLKNEYKISPIMMCFINILIPLLLTIFTYISQKLSRTIGRAQISFFFTSIALILLYLLTFIHNYNDVLKLYIFRSVFQNCSSAIDKSILYDYINTKKNTGKWMGIQSLNYLAWSISAYFGGWISDITSYRYTFKITTFFYLLSLIIYTPLLWLVPTKEDQ